MTRALAPLPQVTDAELQHRRDRERIRALEIELDEARETIRQLMAGEAVEWRAPIEFALTSSEASLLRALIGHDGVMTKQRIMDLIYANRIDEQPEIKIVDVFVCKLRRKLKPYALEIITVWGRGYQMDAVSAERLKTWYVAT